MAQKLEDMLDADERVKYRARYSVLASIGWSSFLVGAGLIGVWAINWSFGDTVNPIGVFVFVLIFVPWFAIEFREQSVLVTDRRVLYRHGIISHKIDEIAIADIYRVDHASVAGVSHGPVTITRYKGRKIFISFVPNHSKLARVISAQAGLPQPANATGSNPHK